MLRLAIFTICISFLFYCLCYAQQDKSPTEILIDTYFDRDTLSNATQDKNPIVWPYGGIPDTSRIDILTNKISLNFLEHADFSEMIFDSQAAFGDARFNSSVDFSNARFERDAIFAFAEFNDETVFDYAVFKSFTALFDARFDNSANFRDVTFDSLVYFNAIFKSDVDFYGTTFNGIVLFSDAKFDSTAYFINVTFNKTADFSRAKFNSLVHFSGAMFNDKVNFEGSTFSEVVNLTGTSFKQGLDLRRVNFDAVNTIFIDHRTEFPIGDLRLYWNQFKAKDSLRLRLSPSEVTDSTLTKTHFQKIETFYHRLRDNFTAQGNLSSADAVMYELGWQKQAIYGFWSWEGFKQTLYGWFFGWGYRPWKFLAFVIVPVIVGFAGLWYGKFYTVLGNAIYQKEIEAASERIGPQEGSVFLKVWHSVLFSASALLGLRFQKAWILKHKSFLFWVTLEWVVGIGLFVLFALLVKSNQFEYIKGLLGF